MNSSQDSPSVSGYTVPELKAGSTHGSGLPFDAEGARERDNGLQAPSAGGLRGLKRTVQRAIGSRG